jgi:hypothetical protein
MRDRLEARRQQFVGAVPDDGAERRVDLETSAIPIGE